MLYLQFETAFITMSRKEVRKSPPLSKFLQNSEQCMGHDLSQKRFSNSRFHVHTNFIFGNLSDNYLMVHSIP